MSDYTRKLACLKLPVILGFIFLLITGSTLDIYSGQVANCDESYSAYTVQPGDKLYEIGINYGDFRFWEAIYIANADQINDPNLIYPGQQLKIPNSIYYYLESDTSLNEILRNPFCANRLISVSAVDWSRLVYYTLDDFSEGDNSSNNLADQGKGSAIDDSESKLADFREAFNALVKASDGETNSDAEIDSVDTERRRDAVQQQSERQIMMEIDGMVIDETRSKVGRDFYDVFYTNWQQPPDTYNFSIRIAEQPSPSLGTIIYVEVNDTETFRMRLQPRYEFIQQAGQYAVRQTYSYLQNNDHRLQIY